MHGHQYTPEERHFFEEYVTGHSYREIQTAFIDRFQWEISLSQIKGYIANHKLNTGRTGAFEKGKPSHNKGKKGECATGCEKSWFKKGHVPENYRPVGSERVSKDGYIEIKVADPKKWKMKHRVVWEQHNGPVPKDSCIIFLDGNKLNVDISNLQMIKRKILARMNQNDLFYSDPEITKVGVNIAEVANAVGEAKKRRKKEQRGSSK